MSSSGLLDPVFLTSALVPYFNLNPPEIGEFIGIPNVGRLVHWLVHSFPKLQRAYCLLVCICNPTMFEDYKLKCNQHHTLSSLDWQAVHNSRLPLGWENPWHCQDFPHHGRHRWGDHPVPWFICAAWCVNDICSHYTIWSQCSRGVPTSLLVVEFTKPGFFSDPD